MSESPAVNNAPKAFALLGPTASGKTALALELAARFPCEIISLDSALVYRGMDIGTAKPSTAELAAAPHHLIDIIDPPASYSAADFVADCTRLAGEIHARGRLPLIVGGTMMYYRALSSGLNELPAADAAVRAQLQDEKNRHGLAHLYQRLQTLDPATAARLNANDSQRIERALEVLALTGRPLSEHFQAAGNKSALTLHALALIPAERSRLHRVIGRRFAAMLEQGLADEVRALAQRYPELDGTYPAMRCVGYRQTWDCLFHGAPWAELPEKGAAATRQLAKRQLTWLRSLSADTALDPYAAPPTAAAADALQRFCDC